MINDIIYYVKISFVLIRADNPSNFVIIALIWHYVPPRPCAVGGHDLFHNGFVYKLVS